MQTIIRYNELFLKSDFVKREMLSQLKANVHKSTGKSVGIIQGRLFIGDYNKKIHEALLRVFGVASFSPVIVVDKNMKDIESAASKLMEKFSKKKTFKIEAVRSDKSFALNSQQIKQQVGEIFYNKGYKVRMKNPDKLVTIEIRDKAYVYDESFQGPGGMPFGTAGYFSAELCNKNDLLASWLMMKRGAVPMFTKANEKLKARLEKWSSGRKLKTVDVARVEARVTGETSIKELGKLPVATFAPLVGFNANQIKALTAKI